MFLNKNHDKLSTIFEALDKGQKMTALQQFVSKETGIPQNKVEAVLRLFAEEATVPFIARYRKEATGGLSETEIINIRDQAARIQVLEKRKEAVIKSLKEQEKLTPDLEKAVSEASSLASLEDLYLPFRPKRKTRASAARDKGLSPLADLIRNADIDFDVSAEAENYINPEKEVSSAEEALAGARDILAEEISETAEVRTALRRLFTERGFLSSRVVKGKEEEGKTYRDYFSYREPALKAPSHRVLAVLRGKTEGVLAVHALPEEQEALSLLRKTAVPQRMLRRSGGIQEEPISFRTEDGGAVTSGVLNSKALNSKVPASAWGQFFLALEDSYSRLISPSLEKELLNAAKERAEETALSIFAGNLREVLLSPPLGGKRVLAVDPGQRTGCKLVCLDAQGKLLETGLIHLFKGEDASAGAGKTVRALAEKYGIEAVAVGNGTGGRETLSFFINAALPGNPAVVMVNESGASVYSASPAAREEFPNLDLTYRGAVSIGRRLQDPLAELVKVDPKSIGVGQYQHDVDQKRLKLALDDVVVSCVNSVGVDVNRASRELLGYVSGLTEKTAREIILRRDSLGPLSSREDLLKISGFGTKTFQQAAGFLRVKGGTNPLDGSAVHPERYALVEKMAADIGAGVSDLLAEEGLRKRIDVSRYVSQDTGLPTLMDIITELEKPGRDPRTDFEVFNYTDGIDDIRKLEKGMRLPGLVTNVTAFGAFVDIGVHQDGLVHISRMAKEFVRDPSQIVKTGQRVMVSVIDVDLDRGRISLSMLEED